MNEWIEDKTDVMLLTAESRNTSEVAIVSTSISVKAAEAESTARPTRRVSCCPEEFDGRWRWIKNVGHSLMQAVRIVNIPERPSTDDGIFSGSGSVLLSNGSCPCPWRFPVHAAPSADLEASTNDKISPSRSLPGSSSLILALCD